MAKKTPSSGIKSTDYRHRGQKRTNIPPAKIAAEGKVPRVPKVRYHYSPHLPPELQFDPDGKADQLPHLITEAGRRTLTLKEQQQLAQALRTHQPWIEWAGKREQYEKGFFEVDPVALHIHERISTQAVLRILAREDVQRDLFADPQQPYAQAVQFYKHAVEWANRLILGDSLQVMTSLSLRENLAGKIQMIYVDPPYGIKFASNFQPQIGQRDVKDRDKDLTREPEMVRAYRDTWTLGIHSYLKYLCDRFEAARLLLAQTGSIFVQISDVNLHRVRAILDEVFGPTNFCSLIPFSKTASTATNLLSEEFDYLLWYAKDISQVKYRQLFKEKTISSLKSYKYAQSATSAEFRTVTQDEKRGAVPLPDGWQALQISNIASQEPGRPEERLFLFQGVEYDCGEGRHWKTTNPQGLTRLARAGRLLGLASQLNFRRYLADFPASPLSNLWDDTGSAGYASSDPKIFVVQTDSSVIERCMLMTTDPGDLVLDPTCGSGTTAYVAELWGRRWITCDTSRVALSLARQRLMTSRFPYYQLRPLTVEDEQRNPDGTWLTEPGAPASGKKTFNYKTFTHISLKSIARNTALDPIFSKHDPLLEERLKALNIALERVTADLRQKLAAKLIAKQKLEGKRSITDADRRRWQLPRTKWRDWEVPFDADQDWPQPLQDALTAYRKAWVTRIDEVNSCVANDADMEELVDKPEIVNGVVRVSGPFTVEGVRPEELSLGDDGLFDPTPNEFETNGEAEFDARGDQNIQSYLAQILQHLRSDGVTFLGNQQRKFARVEALFGDASGSLIHAEGAWEGANNSAPNTVAVSFGPQNGPVTALQVEEAIRAAKRYDELVIAGFSFDAEAYASVEEQSHPKLRIHVAQIRPDLNEAMEGLLKDTPNSQLFTVFGQPEIVLKEAKGGWVCTLKGVDIYNPVENTVRSSGADKVAAWFLDSDFDGRCFCITQAFFPDQNAWEKIAKALGSSADNDAFSTLNGTVSLPFAKGKFGRVAVKVIDARGNEVMAVRKLG